ncbi:MAG: uracil-DNA glycosylase family protein [Fibrobacterota bacterium]
MDKKKLFLEQQRRWGNTVWLPFTTATAQEEPREAPETETPSNLPALGKKEMLSEIAGFINTCRNCGLGKTRTKAVPGEGSPDARLMFVGEAPGQSEDIQGRPFVGKAGQLLTKMIENGLKMSRKDVFICNILKCRPPDNRDPSPQESETCIKYLRDQVKVIAPEVICCLGRVAARNILKTEESTGRLRGRVHLRGNSKIIVTYHPSYLLRNESAKKSAWEDLKLVMKVLNNEKTREKKS